MKKQKKRLLCILGKHDWIDFEDVSKDIDVGMYRERSYHMQKCNYCNARRWIEAGMSSPCRTLKYTRKDEEKYEEMPGEDE